MSGALTLLPFTVLRHVQEDGAHFDWLFDPGGGAALLTWRFDCDLGEAVRRGRAAGVRQPDHRRRYLNYEGPLSGGRGTVAVVMRGHAALVPAATGEQAGYWLWARGVAEGADDPRRLGRLLPVPGGRGAWEFVVGGRAH